jgi:hypothetical protein
MAAAKMRCNGPAQDNSVAGQPRLGTSTMAWPCPPCARPSPAALAPPPKKTSPRAGP